MLIGLLAKTAILITEYAIERRRKGMGIVESAYSAAQVRLRPILMTVLTMIFGMLPLMFASGAGANGNSSLGTGTVGGMVYWYTGITVYTCLLCLSYSNICRRRYVPFSFSRRPIGRFRRNMQKLSRKDNITLKAKKKRKNEKTNHHSNRRSTHTE